MSQKLTDLKNMVAKMFENAESKEDVDNLAKFNSLASEVEEEVNNLEKSNKELLTSYKDVVMHSSYKPSKQPQATPEPKGKAPDFESALKDFMEVEAAKAAVKQN